jgi:hypothetical protein
MNSKNKPVSLKLNPQYLGFKSNNQINTPNSKK